MFISFDGVDGVGKSTQVELCCQRLRALGHDVVECRDPGSTPLGEAVRRLLLHRGDTAIDLRAEMLLYMAARAQLVDEVIRPALSAGKVVVADRYLLANVVYQGHAGGLDVDDLWRVGAIAVAGMLPDVTILLDMPLEDSARRIQRELDHLEDRGDEFRRRLREGFLIEARRQPDRIAIVDAGRTVDEVHRDVWNVVAGRLTSTGAGCQSPEGKA